MKKFFLFICLLSHLFLQANLEDPLFTGHADCIDCSVKKSQVIRPHLVIQSLWGMGFFEDFLTAIGALHIYEQGVISGVFIDYNNGGTYFDPALGPNWWEYYFEPIRIGKQIGNALITVHSIEIDGVNYDLPRLTEFHILRKDVKRLIDKYVHVKPHIKQKVDRLVHDLFRSAKVIGVHYRGTDKWTEDPLAPYEKVAGSVDEAIVKFESEGHSEIKIFIATDEQKFLDYMKFRYPSKVICYEECERSINGNSVHLSGEGGTPYKKGEDALIDCLLLSRTDILLKTSSNLSLCSMYFNPHIPVIHITSRWWHPPLE